MFNFNNIRSIAAVVLASASLLISCVGLEEDGNDAVGYLDVPALEVDLAVDDLLLTKALDFEVVEPSVSDVHFVVKDKNGTVRYDGNGLWEEPLVLPVGSYSVEASYGSNGFGAPYFTGSAEGSIGHLGKVTPELTMKLSNSLVKVSVASSLEGHFTPGNEVSFNDGIHTAGYNTWTYVPAGQDISVTLAGTNSAGTPASFTHTLSNPSPKVAYDVVCGKSETNWPEIKWQSESLADGAFENSLYFMPVVPSNMSDSNASSLKYQIKGGDYADWTDVTVSDVEGYKYVSDLAKNITYAIRAYVGSIFSEERTFVPVAFAECLEMEQVSAVHNNGNDASVQLTGTTMTIKELKVNLPSIIADIAVVTASGSFNSETNGATGSFATIELSSVAKDISFTNASGWPYLPKGDKAYNATVIATCIINGTDIATATLNADVSVPAPVFSVSASAYTSYDKRTTDLSFANNHANKYTVFERKASVNISNDLLSNPNYDSIRSSSITFNSIEIGSFNQNSKDFGNEANCSEWKNYPLYVQMTFDGFSDEASVDCHITGLPYTLSHPAQGWSIVENGAVNYIRFTDQYIFLTSDSSTGSVKTPDFNIPGNTNVSVSTTFKRIRDGILTDWTFSVHTYDNSGQTLEIDSHKGNGKNTVHTIGGDATLTPSCYNILCRRYYWGGSGPDAQITDFSIVYRN